ncbi:hypothetical protein [Microvirga sp.]|uniref:hypothetical protein n=1 Tax=Microvirga sp. TaxID=1873136 RepID=UPI001FEF1584|nr:hypothetical protein [Microvirga sp.]
MNRPIGQSAQASIVAANGCEDGRNRQALQDHAMDALHILALSVEARQSVQPELPGKSFLQHDITDRFRRGLGEIQEQDAAFILRRTVALAVESPAYGRIGVGGNAEDRRLPLGGVDSLAVPDLVIERQGAGREQIHGVRPPGVAVRQADQPAVENHFTQSRPAVQAGLFDVLGQVSI